MKYFFSIKQKGQKAADMADYYVTRLFSGSITRGEEQAVEAWCAMDKNNKTEFNRALDAWSSVDGLEKDADIILLCDTAEKNNIAEKRFGYWPGLALAASLFCAILIYQPGVPLNDETDLLKRYSTAIGEQRVIVLPDESIVTLNTNSRLIVDFTDSGRRTVLDYGEAFFEVSPNPSRPFSVELGARAITVLGTKFNVQKAGRGELKVAVVEGVVAIHRKEDNVSPTAPLLSLPQAEETFSIPVPDQYRIKQGSVVVLKETDYMVSASQRSDIENLQSWRQGVVRFDSQPLASVVREINRYTEKKILVEDTTAMELEVSAVLHVNRLDSILDGLERTLPIAVTRHTDHIVIAMRKNQDY